MRLKTYMPANSNASQKAGAVLNYIAEMKNGQDFKVISGQHGQWGAEFMDKIIQLYDKTGKWAGLVAYDYTEMSTGYTPEPSDIHRSLIDYWNAGGLISISDHFANPFTGRGAQTTPFDAVDLRQLIESGTTVNQTWMAALTRIAGYLTILRDAGVVVLWRPLHEMNGDWFWWSRRGTNWATRDDYVNLWRHMFNYFTCETGLNNLLWVYSANYNQTPLAGWEKVTDYFYPGDEYVDIVGMSIYSDDLIVGGYNELAAIGKPFALTEVGPMAKRNGTWDNMIIINQIEALYPKASYWCSYQSWKPNGLCAMIDQPNANALMNDSRVVDRDQIDLTVSLPLPPPSSVVNVAEQIRNKAWNSLYPPGGIDYYPPAAFAVEARARGLVEARARGLGAPTTQEFRVRVEGVQYAGQGYCAAILWCVEGDWRNIERLAW